MNQGQMLLDGMRRECIRQPVERGKQVLNVFLALYRMLKTHTAIVRTKKLLLVNA